MGHLIDYVQFAQTCHNAGGNFDRASFLINGTPLRARRIYARLSKFAAAATHPRIIIGAPQLAPLSVDPTSMTDPKHVIEVRNLTKSYGKSQVLKGIDLQVERGTMLALLGPNGAGKTTTVRILSTLLRFDGGSVLVDGHDVRTDADKVRAVIGLTGQAAAVDELLTGRENLVMVGQLYRLTAASSRVRAQELLEEFDLLDAAERQVKTYSGGMRRRLDLAK